MHLTLTVAFYGARFVGIGFAPPVWLLYHALTFCHVLAFVYTFWYILLSYAAMVVLNFGSAHFGMLIPLALTATLLRLCAAGSDNDIVWTEAQGYAHMSVFFFLFQSVLIRNKITAFMDATTPTVSRDKT